MYVNKASKIVSFYLVVNRIRFQIGTMTYDL